MMVLVTLFLPVAARGLVGFFTQATDVIEIGATYLRIISWNFVAQGIIFTCSGMFQGARQHPARDAEHGDPAHGIRARRNVDVTQPGFKLDQLWVLSVVTVWFQALVSYLLLRHQFNRRLVDGPSRPMGAPVGAPAPAEGPDEGALPRKRARTDLVRNPSAEGWHRRPRIRLLFGPFFKAVTAFESPWGRQFSSTYARREALVLLSHCVQ